MTFNYVCNTTAAALVTSRNVNTKHRLLSDRCCQRRPSPSRYAGWSSRCCERWSSQPISVDISHEALPSVTAQCLTGSPTNDTVPVTNDTVLNSSKSNWTPV